MTEPLMCEYLTTRNHTELTVGDRDTNADGSCPWEAVWRVNGEAVCDVHVTRSDFEVALRERIQ